MSTGRELPKPLFSLVIAIVWRACCRAASVNKLCISIDGQVPEFCYSVGGSLKERNGRQRVKLKLFVSG
jgi:hypothetical protein